MKQTVIYEVSEILDTFNLDEISQLLRKQIEVDGSDLTLREVDHFKPLYYKYQSIIQTPDNSDEIKQTATKRFMDICNIFLSMICDKYSLEIDETWRDDHYQDLPGFTMSLYSFFILDIQSTIYEVCLNYILKNTDYIYQAFEERKNKKDASTLINKKLLSQELAVILSNVYDVTTWILSQLSEEQFLLYANQDYCPLKLLSSLFEEGIIGGDYMVEINDLYATDITLKSEVCLKIMTYLKKMIQK